jgi:hypothetical protein
MPYPNYEDQMDISFFTEKGIKANLLQGKYTGRFLEELGDNAPVSRIKLDVLFRRNFVMYSIFSISPPWLRGVIYKDGSYWDLVGSGRADVVGGSVVDCYSVLYYLPEITDTEESAGTYTALVNNITHEHSFLQYPDYTVVSQITDFGPNLFNGHSNSHRIYHVNAAAYLLLSKWFEKLKEMDVYDNTRIIVVSDHDERVVKPLFSPSMNRINTFYNPILLIKDFNASEEIETINTFMTTADVPLLALKDIIENPANPFTGRLLKADKENGVNIFLGGSPMLRDYTGYEALDKTSSFYHVEDDIFDEKNWTRITKNFDN